ncbi:BTAD domain-containing putative transcriptional regulator [Deinococcus aquiradiocola]|uniref:Transcriptional activator n=1 Tax=Deinococcus aquiradiocola TaxID=393059 RepID=A0A917PHK7_9DEIO|nr:BTAD domain-containing putative transcriptional regulator [Deinococcus aquiradiocola]GGJ78052.1 transcriptional activator [Deinococcus aquiradiocola]
MTLQPSWRDLTSQRRTRPPNVRGVLPRLRVTDLLGAARVGVVVAPAGYGKTTALAALPGPLCWLTLDADDADPQVLAAGLALAAEALEDGFRVAALLDAGATPRLVAARLGDLLERVGATLVIDEAQHLAHPLVSEVLGRLLGPPGGGARVVLLSRLPLASADLTRLEAAGELRRLSVADLAFTPAEVAALAATQGVTLTPAEVRVAHAVTEGWPIAVRFLMQAAGQGRLHLSALDELSGGPAFAEAPLTSLFTYLAQEVLGPLDPALRTLLTQGSVFEELTAGLLVSVLQQEQAGLLLDALAGSGTFLTRVGDGYRAHPLLRAHLRSQLPPGEVTRLAARGAAYFEETGRPRRAMAAHLQAGQHGRAAALLARHGQAWLAQGRTQLVQRSLNAVPLGEWTPDLYALSGDALRASSRYAEALARYAHAGPLQRALGEARVALDTVQPALAWAPLETAAELTAGAGTPERPGTAVTLRRMQAENLLNAGQLAEALALDPALATGARALLRSGQLTAALPLALQAARGESGGARAAQNHREGLLLLSFLQALLGDGRGAETHAREGLAEGERLESPFVQGLALARLGHALLVQGDSSGAAGAYRDAYALATGVTGRLQVEPLLGLTVLAARTGDAAGADLQLQDALLRSGGDRYMAGLLTLAAGLGQLQGGRPDAARPHLQRAADLFGTVGDRFGLAATHLAQYAALHAPGGPQDEHTSAACREEHAGQARAAVLAYPFLLSRPSLLSPFPERARRAALLASLAAGVPGGPDHFTGIARDLGYPRVPCRQDVPGFEVKVQVLGGRVSVQRDGRESREWGRAKARDLLALLALHPAGLARDEAQDALFPDAEVPVAERNFRVTLHALGQVLEDGAVSGTFLERGEWLRLRVSPDLTVDLHAAWALLAAPAGTPGRLDGLLALPDALADVPLPQVQDAAARYSAQLPDALAAEAALAFQVGESAAAQRAAARALTLDPAHEPAARLQMRAAHAAGHMAAVTRTYRALEAALALLDLTPLPETAALHRALTGP